MKSVSKEISDVVEIRRLFAFQTEGEAATAVGAVGVVGTAARTTECTAIDDGPISACVVSFVVPEHSEMGRIWERAVQAEGARHWKLVTSGAGLGDVMRRSK